LPFFLFLFIVLPIAELTVLIQVGSEIGALSTVGLLFLTAFAGIWLLRHQGLATLLRANERLNSGELPAREVAEGFILAAGGMLLLVPGFITDVFGLLCLLPGIRQWFARQALKRMTIGGQSQSFYFFRAGGQPFERPGPFGPAPGPGSNGDVIEGEYQDRTESGRRQIGEHKPRNTDDEKN